MAASTSPEREEAGRRLTRLRRKCSTSLTAESVPTGSSQSNFKRSNKSNLKYWWLKAVTSFRHRPWTKEKSTRSNRPSHSWGPTFPTTSLRNYLNSYLTNYPVIWPVKWSSCTTPLWIRALLHQVLKQMLIKYLSNIIKIYKHRRPSWCKPQHSRIPSLFNHTWRARSRTIW